MKKLLTYLGVLCLGAMSYRAHAQLSVGAKTGVNLNQFQQPGTTIGLNAGAYAAYKVNSFISVKLEPQYSQEGGGRPTYIRYYYEISNDVYAIEYLNPSIRFHNLQVPVLVELTLPELSDQTVAPVLIVGASYAMMGTAFEQHTKRYDLIDESEEGLLVDVSYQRENVTSNYKRNQWSLLGGMGFQVKTGNRIFQFDVRYRHGLNNLNLLRFASPGDGINHGVPGTGGKLFSSSVTFNFSMSLFNF